MAIGDKRTSHTVGEAKALVAPLANVEPEEVIDYLVICRLEDGVAVSSNMDDHAARGQLALEYAHRLLCLLAHHEH